jgi:hypothetical protein
MTENIQQIHYTDYQTVKEFMAGFNLARFITPENINETMLSMTDAYINTNTMRDFKLHSGVVEFHHGNGKDYIQSYFFPIVRISRMIMYNQLLQAMRVFLDSELIVNPQRGQIYLPPIYPAFMADKPFAAMLGNIFIPGRYNIELDYDYGYASAPEDIKMAATKYVAIQTLIKQGVFITGGATSRSIDGYSESFGKIPYEGLINFWQKEIDFVLKTNQKVFARAI